MVPLERARVDVHTSVRFIRLRARSKPPCRHLGERSPVAIEPEPRDATVALDATAQATIHPLYAWIRGIHPMLWRR